MLFPATGMGVLSARCALFPDFRDGLGDYPRQPNGIVGHRFDFRKLNRRPDKPSDAEGDEE